MGTVMTFCGNDIQRKLSYLMFIELYLRTDVFISVPFPRNKKAYKTLNGEK